MKGLERSTACNLFTISDKFNGKQKPNNSNYIDDQFKRTTKPKGKTSQTLSSKRTCKCFTPTTEQEYHRE